jgi:hypothetical protein
MKERGQVLVIVAVLLIVCMLVLALVVDGGRLYVEEDRLKRSAQAAADAGIGWISEQMVTQAIPRQTQAAGMVPCMPDGDFGAVGGTCTATPEPERIGAWLNEDDLATLRSPDVIAGAQAIAVDYAHKNGIRDGGSDGGGLSIAYPYTGSSDGSLGMLVRIRQRTNILLAGLLSDSYVDLEVEALSEIPLR